MIYRLDKFAENSINPITDTAVHKLPIDDYSKCNNIWDMKKSPFTEKFHKEIESGNRTVFVYEENSEFIGEIAVVFDMKDSDYTIPKSGFIYHGLL
ncbi:MAG: hypothetical protein LUG95_03745 [Clostridiales bacterium]|nr:hypothetical protein [Clostridiales bacterium]